MNRLNMALLKQVKQAFVQMPAESGVGPVAGGGMLTQAQAAPMGGAPMDPAAMGGAPMDPAAMGMDPAAMGGAPMDPAAMGMGAAGQIVLNPDEFIRIIQAIGTPGGKVKAKAGNGADPAAGATAQPAGNGGGSSTLEAKIDQLLSMLGGAGAPPQM